MSPLLKAILKNWILSFVKKYLNVLLDPVVVFWFVHDKKKVMKVSDFKILIHFKWHQVYCSTGLAHIILVFLRKNFNEFLRVFLASYEESTLVRSTSQK